MTLAKVFELSGLTVMPFWALMVFAPKWEWTERVLRSWLVVLVPSLLYVALVVPQLPAVFAVVTNPDLANVSALLGSERGALIGWIHFLAFDLFVGRLVFFDAKERGLPWFVTSAVLPFILLLGPVGLSAYLLIRAVPARVFPRAALVPAARDSLHG